MHKEVNAMVTTVVSDIIDHYLGLFDIRSFYFAMFAPYIKREGGEYDFRRRYKPAFPSFEVKTSDILENVNICASLKDRFEQFHQRMLAKDPALRPDFSDYAFGFISRIKLAKNKKAWLILIDFNCKVSDENLDKVRLALKILKTGSGLIVNSGKSYHFYGDKTFTDYRAWQGFYKGGLYFNDFGETNWPKTANRVIGDNWPKFTLQQGFAMLRVNQCSPRPLPLEVIEYFQGGELEERPPSEYPCSKRQSAAYVAAMAAIDKAKTEEEENKILKNWPVVSRSDMDFWKRFCELPCELQGKTLLCPE